MSKLWVDPPEGWRYGFPKIWDSEEYPVIADFLREWMYPEHLIKLGHCRMWDVDGEDTRRE